MQQYPANSVRVQFTPLNGRKQEYRVWRSSNMWLWHAAGNDGAEDTQELAMAAARRWILTTSQIH